MRFHRNGVGRLVDTLREMGMALRANICFMMSLLKTQRGRPAKMTDRPRLMNGYSDYTGFGGYDGCL